MIQWKKRHFESFRGLDCEVCWSKRARHMIESGHYTVACDQCVGTLPNGGEGSRYEVDKEEEARINKWIEEVMRSESDVTTS